MQQIMLQQGFMGDKEDKDVDPPSKKVKSKVVKINLDDQARKGKEESNDSDSNSDTTVYKNAVANTSGQVNADHPNKIAVDVDSEITFNMAKQRTATTTARSRQAGH